MLRREPAQRFPRSSLLPSMPSARLSLRNSLSRKRRRATKQLQSAMPLPPIPEVASREVTPTPPEAEATATSSAYTSGLTSGATTGFSTTAQTAVETVGVSPTEPDDAARSPISPLTPAGLEVAPPSPPTSPSWWLNLPYPSATTTPLPLLNAELTPWDPRTTSWRGSYVPVLKAWELHLTRHLGAFSPGPSLSLHIPTTPPPRQQAEADTAPRLPSLPSAPRPLLPDEDIRWTNTGSPAPPAVPPKTHHHHPDPLPTSLTIPIQPHAGPTRWPPASLPGTFPPSPTPSEPPSPRSPSAGPLSPFPSPPPPHLSLVPPAPTTPSPSPDLPEVVPEQGGGLHVVFPVGEKERRVGRGGKKAIRRASSFPPTIPMVSTPETRALYRLASRSVSSELGREYGCGGSGGSGGRGERRERGKKGKRGDPVTAVRKKSSVWGKVKGRVMEVLRGGGDGEGGGGGGTREGRGRGWGMWGRKGKGKKRE